MHCFANSLWVPFKVFFICDVRSFSLSVYLFNIEVLLHFVVSDSLRRPQSLWKPKQAQTRLICNKISCGFEWILFIVYRRECLICGRNIPINTKLSNASPCSIILLLIIIWIVIVEFVNSWRFIIFYVSGNTKLPDISL